LASKPNDPAANLAVGQFDCFVKAEWDRGLPLLALGSDAELRALAEKELAGVSDAGAQVELGDGWWALSETEAGLARDHLREHAAKWYERAQPSLEGLAKAKVEKRLKEVEALASQGLPARGATNSLGMRFVAIPPGTFTMGSSADEAGRFDNETQHKVTLTKSFLMATTHVTRGQFTAFVRDSGYQTDAEKDGWSWEYDGTGAPKTNGASWRNPGFDQRDDHPVVQVSWNDATAFCDWLSRKERKHYRLPTEAEWEYAARGGTQTAFPWGNNPDDGRGWANSGDQTANQRFPNIVPFNWTDGYVFTSPVGKFKPNGFGLYDMIGNAFEWCSDWLGDYPDSDATDPRGPDNGEARVLRGGSWCAGPRARCAIRIGVPPIYRASDLGFRVVLDADRVNQSPANRIAVSKNKLVIIRAVFGDLPGGAQADVTATVAAAVSDNRLRIDASRGNFGDPAYGHLKRLWVDYTLGGVRNSKSVSEDETLVIP
jgi:formylglycine-generating enzyme required for sulfatase activity